MWKDSKLINLKIYRIIYRRKLAIISIVFEFLNFISTGIRTQCK